MTNRNTPCERRCFSWSLVSFVVFSLFYFVVSLPSVSNVNPEGMARNLDGKIDAVVQHNQSIFKQMETLIKEDSAHLNWFSGLKRFNDYHQTVLLSKNGQLVFWNHADIPFDIKNIHEPFFPVIRQFKSGWFLIDKKSFDKYDVWVLAKFQNQFSIHNAYLANHNTPLFSMPSSIHFAKRGNLYLKTYDVYLQMTGSPVYQWQKVVSILVFFLAYFSLLLLLYFSYRWLAKGIGRNNNTGLGIAFILDSLLLRFLDSVFQFPAFVKQFPLFQTSISTIPGFQSVGDLILDGFVLFFVLIGVNQILKPKTPQKNYLFYYLSFFSLLTLLLPLFLYSLLDEVLLNIGFNNTVSFGWINNILLGKLTLILAGNVAIYYWVKFISDYFKRGNVSLVVWLGSLLLAGALLYLVIGFETLLFGLVLVYLLLLVILHWMLDPVKSPYLYLILLLVIISSAGSILFNLTESEIKNSHQRLTAELLTQKTDPYLEFRLKQIEPQILNDSKLPEFFAEDRPDNEYQLNTYLRTNYFNRYFSSYSVQFTLCQPAQKIAIEGANQIMSCDQYFASLDVKKIYSRPSFQLLLVNGLQQSLYYIAKFRFPLHGEEHDSLNMYVEFFKDFIPKGLGYPELLVDDQQTKLQLAGYSFARYSDGVLDFKFGDFLYPVMQSYFNKQKAGVFFYRDGYKHLLHKEGKKEYLIISRPKTNLSQYLLSFSLLFLFSGLTTLLIIFVIKNKQIKSLFNYSLRTRLQLIFFSSVLFIFILLSVVTLYYFNKANQQRVESELKEKAHSVLIELQHKFENYGDYEVVDSAVVQNYLQKFSLVFFSDINLYDLSGRLLASSRPEIFAKGLQSGWMNPQAFYHIVKQQQLFYFSHEQIGKMTFNSTYLPFILSDGRTVGVINLPYFARNTEIQSSYYQMMANLINLFVLTGIIGLVFMMFLSRILTKPLKILQDKIRIVSIDRKNERIEWKENDEIGQLIDSYNHMVSKLEQSTELLKSSEREKAWREMARQIAHEIRNPLTPMKLNVQYLEKAYAEKDLKFGEKLHKTSQNLIKQIDTLNEVAGMFSDFSKTGVRKTQKSDLVKTLNESLALFKKSYDITFDVVLPGNEAIMVNASESDLIRIFTNIIKNAIQAMEGNFSKRIEIKLEKQANGWSLYIRDFGKGISKEHRKNIFKPYFTTKSTGTGLGLAIVKNMMHEMGGSVDFESSEGEGTQFHLFFPVH